MTFVHAFDPASWMLNLFFMVWPISFLVQLARNTIK